jgi:hypothetical protein
MMATNLGSFSVRGRNRKLAECAVKILDAEHPMTLRQLFYRVVSTGLLANSQAEYHRLGRLMTRLREERRLSRTWIVDHIRQTLKPNSWSGLEDFGNTVQRTYRKNLWHSLPMHIEIFVEKDAIAGTIQPVTEEYDIRLHVCRGYSSVSFAGEIADLWSRIRKPISAYYVGDFDPSGFDLERDLREKLSKWSDRFVLTECDWVADRDTIEVAAAELDHDPRTIVCWQRLAVCDGDFGAYNLTPLPVKLKDNRAKEFIRTHGNQCAEVDALPPVELRRRVEEAILSHIPHQEWERLKEIEAQEKQSLASFIQHWPHG